jgi:hypothetical protein
MRHAIFSQDPRWEVKYSRKKQADFLINGNKSGLAFPHQAGYSAAIRRKETIESSTMSDGANCAEKRIWMKK